MEQNTVTPHAVLAAAPDDPTFGDLIRFLWSRRVRLVTLFLLTAAVLGTCLLLWRYFIARQVAEGTLSLTFRGMERHEYPSGRKFSVEDLRSPQVLTRARTNAGVADKTDVNSLYVGTEITPVIPSEIQARWRKQDRDGTKREEYFPQDFRIRVNARFLTGNQRVQFLAAVIRAYQDDVRFEHAASLRRFADFSAMSPADLIQNYDTWDLPTLLAERERNLRQQIEALVIESRDFSDPNFRMTFRDVGNDLTTWRDTRLEALTAFIYKGRVVKDRDLMLKRLQQRLEELDVQVKQLSGEAEQSTKLVESLDRSKPLLAGPLTNRDGAPLVDSTALEKLVRSDYVGPVVKRITELHKQAKEAEAEKARTEREIAILGKSDAGMKPPAGLEALVALVTKDLARIVANYNKVLDDYMNATVTSLVALKQGPSETREGPTGKALAMVLIAVSVLLPFVVVFFESSMKR
ncbi:MAG: hypothetical protein ABI584_15785 [Acidobacteriota bacterium]